MLCFIFGDLINIEKNSEYEILLIYVAKHFRNSDEYRKKNAVNNNDHNRAQTNENNAVNNAVPQSIKDSMTRYVDKKVKDLSKYKQYVCTEIGRDPGNYDCWDKNGSLGLASESWALQKATFRALPFSFVFIVGSK